VSDGERPVPDADAGAPEPTPFEMLVYNLAAQVQFCLGLIADPRDGKPRKDLPAARRGIDMLSALEERTKGNLSPEEAGMLAGLLTQFRLRYVQEAGKRGEQA
jgi:hypothetical protein